MLQFLYVVILYLIQPLILCRLWIKGQKVRGYRERWGERYGFCKGKLKPNGILLHAVSVGEALSSVNLVKKLRLLYPTLPITLTTTTPTASARIQSIFGEEIYHVYLPYDLPCAMSRFLNNVKPKLVIVMETELWPTMIKQLHVRSIPLILANARLSSRSVSGYKKVNKFVYKLLDCLTLVAAQSEEDGARFIELGLKPSKLVIMGNIKFDISVAPEIASRSSTLRKQWVQDRHLWIAASTHEGEEELILEAYQQLLFSFPKLLLIIAPRHPERFSAVEGLVRKKGLNYILRSQKGTPSNETQVVIGDTMGELMLLYGIADLAFVGGSLIENGGHNPLEPAAQSLPILMGPYVSNFKEICRKLNEANALITVTDAVSLRNQVAFLLGNEKKRKDYGRNAEKVLRQNQGALQHLLDLIESYLIETKASFSHKLLSSQVASKGR